MRILTACALVLLAALSAPAAVQPVPPAKEPPPVVERHSILPRFDPKVTANYTLKATTINAVSKSPKGWQPTGSPAEEELTANLRVRTLKLDTRTDEAEVEIEVISLQVTWDNARGSHETFDSAKKFVPKPQPRLRPRNRNQPDPDGNAPGYDGLNGLTFDRYMEEHFRPMVGAKARYRVDPRGKIVSKNIDDAFMAVPGPMIGALLLPNHFELLFGPAWTNGDKTFTGTVKAGQQWDYERVFTPTHNNKNNESTRTEFHYTVRDATPTRIDIAATGAFKPPAVAKPDSSYISSERILYTWNPATGRPDNATFEINTTTKNKIVKDYQHYTRGVKLTLERIPDPTPEKKPDVEPAKTPPKL